MEVPLPLLSGGNQAQLNEHGSTSHVPVHRNVTGCRTVGWVAETVKSAVGTADAEPADPTSAAAVSRSAAVMVSRRLSTTVLRSMGCAFCTERENRAPRSDDARRPPRCQPNEGEGIAAPRDPLPGVHVLRRPTHFLYLLQPRRKSRYGGRTVAGTASYRLTPTRWCRGACSSRPR